MIPYTRAHINSCSNKRPMHPSTYTKSLFSVDTALTQLRIGADPKMQDWVALAGIVNVMDALVMKKCITDESGLIAESVKAMAEARIRNTQGHAIRLSGTGLQAISSLMQDYKVCLEGLSERTIKGAINFAWAMMDVEKRKAGLAA